MAERGRKASARGPSNVALVKYWGKRDDVQNLPETGSISVTLEGLEARTTVAFDAGLARDEVTIDGARDGPGARRVERFLDHVREQTGTRAHARVTSHNDFPTGAGLASSAAGFAALAVAVDRALGLGLSQEDLSRLARRGSGSAARSLCDGFAEMRAGEAKDGSDAYAVSLGGPDLLPMEVVVAVTTLAKKPVGSTEGMRRTARTSPYHGAWVASTRRDLEDVRAALLAGDLERVGHVAETNALRMHADMIASDPPLLYWRPATVAAMREVWSLRDEGVRAWFTIDAGPQVKVLVAPGSGDLVARRLAAVPGVASVLRARPGRGARLVEGDA